MHESPVVPARIRDVAERAGVSTATVSRALNGDERVDSKMRERVLDASRDLNYRPNRLARNLRRQQLDAIGVVVSDIENPHFSETVRVVEDLALERGFRVLVCNTDESAEKQAAYLRILADERVSGIIISPSDPGADLTPLHSIGIPVVAVDREMTRSPTDAVLPDNVPALYAATQRFIHAGHRRIAFIGGRADVETGSERQDGYLAAMAEAGLPPHIRNGGFRREPAEHAVAALLDSAERPTALVVANNLMALGALRALRTRNVRVPTDLALIAVDNPPWAELIDPPLTVLNQPIREIAEAAVGLLMDRISGATGPVVRRILPLELIVRASCGTATPAAAR